MRMVARAALLTGLLLATSGAGLARGACGDSGVALQVLGSGGPFGAGRASAGYIVWVDGVSRVMMDAGGGTFVRFHQAGATLSDLHVLALSHFHPDHVSDVPALLWPRGGELLMAGPSGRPGFPSVDNFLGGLFGPDGVFRILNSRVALTSVEVDVNAAEPTEVVTEGQVRVRGLGVPHGSVPAVGYRIDVGDASLAFSSDQNGSNPAFTDFVRGVDLLVVHFAGSEASPGAATDLHAKPSVWGQMATDAGAGRLVLSHVSANQDLDANLVHLQTRYRGPLTIASDLLCVAVG